MPLHTLNDGSNVILINAKALVQIPIWNGNRIMSLEHVDKIKKSITDIRNLDFGFRIVTRMAEDADGKEIKERVVVDGQHRHQVLSDYFKENLCSPDFPIVIVEKEIQDESDIITYFNTINTQKPISWKSDPKMIANKYILALQAKYNPVKPKKDILIRSIATKRPYLSTEKLRDKFVELCKRVDIGESSEEIKDFVVRVDQFNTESLKKYELAILYDKKDADIIQKAISLKFMLAIDIKLEWVSICLTSLTSLRPEVR